MGDEYVLHQYRTADLLRIRADMHRLYTEDPVDLDVECASLLGLRDGEAHLDVGCGPGVFLRYLRAHGPAGRLAGVDQSAGMIAAASAPGIEWYVGEADALPFPDGAFASVSARHMLYRVPDIPAALREFARVAVPGGTVLAATNGAGNLPRIPELVGLYRCRTA
jgi:ubiquinone/menaquinone biosynthesis C-methylase UbiE